MHNLLFARQGMLRLKRRVQTRDVALAAVHQQQQHQGKHHDGDQHFNDFLSPKHAL